ncbi:sigma factor [Cohnella herbarum]|uniref:RNA polymerase sigma-70 region 2 domain-containing protein n=1 Tax=Cohnella herbarum TaxID=2728023 RepID=A0A7Z2VH53_9BACL|nr:sigma factor [Cohnella herbarum]QJD82936.1 hypothetical protein HH215_06940 [Cohnella herbarum]
MHKALSDAKFEELTIKHLAELRRNSRKLAGADWDGEDLLQETMLKAFRRYDGLSS